jgi:hypothetical protein
LLDSKQQNVTKHWKSEKAARKAALKGFSIRRAKCRSESAKSIPVPYFRFLFQKNDFNIVLLRAIG